MKQLAEKKWNIRISMIVFVYLLFCFISILVLSFIPEYRSNGVVGISTGLYLLSWSTLFFLSYLHYEKLHILRYLMWFCEKVSYPQSRYMALVYCGLTTILGVLSLFNGIKSHFNFSEQPIETSNFPSVYDGSWLSDPMLYIVIGMNILFGIYKNNK